MTPVLVTGGAGYIGSHTCKNLAQRGFLPVTLDDLSRGFKEAVRWGPLLEARIQDTDLVAKALVDFKIEAVVHFAAFAYVGESVEKPEMYWENNVEGSRSLLRAMKTAGVRRFVFSSSCATYGEAQKLVIDEDHPQNPINPYGQSKLEVERILAELSLQDDLDYCALRYFNAAGADPELETGERHDPEPHIVPSIIAAGIHRKLIKINGNDYPTPDGTCIRDFIHVSDLAEAHGLVLESLLKGIPLKPFYNLGTGKGFSLLQLVKQVENVLGQSVDYTFTARRPGDPARLVASAELFKKEFAWSPNRSDLKTMIETAASWYRMKEKN